MKFSALCVAGFLVATASGRVGQADDDNNNTLLAGAAEATEDVQKALKQVDMAALPSEARDALQDLDALVDDMQILTKEFASQQRNLAEASVEPDGATAPIASLQDIHKANPSLRRLHETLMRHPKTRDLAKLNEVFMNGGNIDSLHELNVHFDSFFDKLSKDSHFLGASTSEKKSRHLEEKHRLLSMDDQCEALVLATEKLSFYDLFVSVFFLVLSAQIFSSNAEPHHFWFGLMIRFF